MATPPDNHAEHTVALQRCVTPLIEALEARRWNKAVKIARSIRREAKEVMKIAEKQGGRNA